MTLKPQLELPGSGGHPGTYQTIINHIRPHYVLVLPFLWNSAVLKHIKRATITIGNEPDPENYRLWENLDLDWLQVNNESPISFLRSLQLAYMGKVTILVIPPYQNLSIRGNGFEEGTMSRYDHIELLQFLKSVAARNVDVIIAIHPNHIYEQQLKEWNRVEYTSHPRLGAKKDCLFMSYQVDALHDYNFLGKDFKEREQLKLKMDRAIKKLDDMTPLERQAFLELYQNYRPSDAQANQQRLGSA